MEFSVAAIIRITHILNSWPCPDRATFKTLDGIANKLDLTDADKEAINWTEVDNRFVNFRIDVTLTKELDELDVQLLRRLVENPPEGLAWTRADKQLQAQVFTPLGLEPWV